MTIKNIVILCILSIFVFNTKSFAIQNDSLKFRKFNIGVVISNYIVPIKNLQSVSFQTVTNNKKFVIGTEFYCRYNFTYNLSFQTGINWNFGKFQREIDTASHLAAFKHLFNEFSIPFGVNYNLIEYKKILGVFVSGGYCLDFIFNRNPNNRNEEYIGKTIGLEMKDAYFQSACFAKLGLIFNKQKVTPFLNLNFYYSQYWRDYYGISVGTNF